MSLPVDLRIDSHKLAFHPHRVAQWLDGQPIFPLYLELSPSGACNHRCTFCAKDYLGYQGRFLQTGATLRLLEELGSLGIRSIMYGGEGEPLLHPDIADLVTGTRGAGIDVAMSTNGVLLTGNLAEKILPALSWIKFSIDAGSAPTYAAIHRTKEDDFRTVLANVADAARIIDRRGLGCTLGTQMLLLPENAAEARQLAERVKEAGADYLVIKPYSQHHDSHNRRYEHIDYAPYLGLAAELEPLNGDGFRVFFRMNTMVKLQHDGRGYDSCLALPFWAYIDAGGDVWGCSSYLGDERFLFGNLYRESFRSIWEGERRRRLLAHAATELDTEGCRKNCRMDEVNRYLWDLTHPGAHVNFI
jgi:radical SAM protein with 4Fe4S-binding SPASM domain